MAVEMTEGAPKNDNANANGVKDKGKKIIRIQVSKTKKPFFFYLNLAKVITLFLLRNFYRHLKDCGNWLQMASFINLVFLSDGAEVYKTGQ